MKRAQTPLWKKLKPKGTIGETLLEYGSWRKTANFLNISKDRLVKMYKEEMGLCNRNATCENEARPGKKSCKECIKRMVDNEDKQKKREYLKEYTKKNKERVLENQRKWYYNNHTKQREYYNKYARENKRCASRYAERRAKNKNAMPSWVNKEEMEEIYQKCPEGYHVDHIIPLTHKDVCGLHVPANLQYLPARDNDVKFNNFDYTYENEGWMKNYSHQYKRRLQTANEDIKNNKPFGRNIKEYELFNEKITPEIKSFIERYEWLGTIGWNPKWCFTARIEGELTGVVLIGEPTNPSKSFGTDPKLEALIQRGAAASWSPKGLNSKLVMFAVNWMAKNTHKKIFTAYSDSEAGEIGTIYQACNFDFLGDKFGASKKYILPCGTQVTDKYFNRTANWRKWCYELNITWEREWNKENGFKDIHKIPEKVKIAIREHIRKIKKQSTSLKQPKKGKYIIIRGENKRETNYLKGIANYKTYPYPKR